MIEETPYQTPKIKMNLNNLREKSEQIRNTFRIKPKDSSHFIDT